MLYRNCIASTIVTGLLLFSFFFLVHITIHQSQHLMSTSKPRLTCFLVMHLYIIAMMVVFLMIESTYGMVKWTFILCLVVAASMTAVQISIYINRVWNGKVQIRTVLPMQMAYINCYFLTYMYSLIGLFISSMFIILTKIGIFVQRQRIMHAIQQCIYPIQYDHQLMHDLECSVCLSPLQDNNDNNGKEYNGSYQQHHDNDNDITGNSGGYNRNDIGLKGKLLQMKCKHIFHYQCLMQWIRINQSCPTCRFNVFEAIQGDQNVDVHVIRNNNNNQ